MVEVDLNQRLEEYESLLETSVELAGSLDLERVLELAMDRAEKLCRAETSSIWELDTGRGELFFRIVRGTAAQEIRDRRVPIGEGIVGRVALSGKSEIVEDVTVDPGWRGELSGSFQTRVVLAVPLKSHGRVIGVLQLLNPRGRLTRPTRLCSPGTTHP